MTKAPTQTIITEVPSIRHIAEQQLHEIFLDPEGGFELLASKHPRLIRYIIRLAIGSIENICNQLIFDKDTKPDELTADFLQARLQAVMDEVIADHHNQHPFLRTLNGTITHESGALYKRVKQAHLLHHRNQQATTTPQDLSLVLTCDAQNYFKLENTLPELRTHGLTNLREHHTFHGRTAFTGTIEGATYQYHYGGITVYRDESHSDPAMCAPGKFFARISTAAGETLWQNLDYQIHQGLPTPLTTPGKTIT